MVKYKYRRGSVIQSFINFSNITHNSILPCVSLRLATKRAYLCNIIKQIIFKLGALGQNEESSGRQVAEMSHQQEPHCVLTFNVHCFFNAGMNSNSRILDHFEWRHRDSGMDYNLWAGIMKLHTFAVMEYNRVERRSRDAVRSVLF